MKVGDMVRVREGMYVDGVFPRAVGLIVEQDVDSWAPTALGKQFNALFGGRLVKVREWRVEVISESR